MAKYQGFFSNIKTRLSYSPKFDGHPKFVKKLSTKNFSFWGEGLNGHSMSPQKQAMISLQGLADKSLFWINSCIVLFFQILHDYPLSSLHWPDLLLKSSFITMELVWSLIYSTGIKKTQIKPMETTPYYCKLSLQYKNLK